MPLNRVLLLSYFCPPMVNPRAFRWQTIATEWLRTQPDCVVDWVGGWEAGLAAYDQPTPGLQVWRSALAGLQRQPSNAQPAAAAGNTHPPAANPLLRLAKWLYSKLYWPDAVFFWQYGAGQRVRQLLAEHRYRALVSIAPFFSAHWLAYQLVQRQPGLFWLADYGDPFSPQTVQAHNNRWLYAGRNRRAEAQVLARANAVTLTTAAQAKLYAAAFPQAAHKLHVIPPVLARPAAASPAGVQPPFDTTGVALRWVCVGKLYESVRRPAFLLRLFAAVQAQLPNLPLELHFVGDSSAVQADFVRYQPLLGKTIFQHGLQPQVVAQAAQQAADVLVNIGNSTAHQLPSKVVEYASSGRPVLNLAQVAADSSAAFFADYPAAQCVWDLPQYDFDAQVQAVCAWLQALPAPLAPLQLAQFLQPYQAQTIAARYWQLLAADAPGG